MRMTELFAAKLQGRDVDIPQVTADNLLVNILNTVYSIVGIVAVGMIIFAGFQYITANGDPQKASTAMRTILFSVIGIIVVVSAFAITNFVVGGV